MPGRWNDRDLPPSVPSHLRSTFESARDGQQQSLNSLRDATCSYVDELRERGVSKDEVEEAVRELFGQLDRSAPIQSVEAGWNSRLIDTMLQWCRDRWRESDPP